MPATIIETNKTPFNKIAIDPVTLDNALRIRDDAAPTWFLLGESYRDLGRFEAALRRA